MNGHLESSNITRREKSGSIRRMANPLGASSLLRDKTRAAVWGMLTGLKKTGDISHFLRVHGVHHRISLPVNVVVHFQQAILGLYYPRILRALD